MARDTGAARAQDTAPAVPDLGELPGGVKAALEAVLMVIAEPAADAELAAALGVPVARVQQLLAELQAEYDGVAGGVPRGFELRSIAGGWRIFSRAGFAPVVSRFVREGQTARLTQASL
ncbi:SMC-Scp complex subunit ScpB, partial [Arthrobacter deserti]|nr:SMC-Scp complex subunit ScpB [Arthrobacter deserti]